MNTKKINWAEHPNPFLPGLELNARYYQEIVLPLLAKHFPGLLHTAGLVGYGSDVLGFDTPMSRDHMWGPRLMLFLTEYDFDQQSESVNQTLRQELPVSFLGYPTNFGSPDGIGVRLLEPVETGPVNHLIHLTTIRQFLKQELGFQANSTPALTDWVTFPEQKLLAVTGGMVYHDDLGFSQVREILAYYPDDIWRYLMACQWARIGQEEAFVGRTGDLGDEIGSRVIAARLVHDLMRLSFFQERRYAPYSKWFGTAFQKLSVAKQLAPALHAVLTAQSWVERQDALCQSYRIAAEQHNRLNITDPFDPQPVRFHERPFMVIQAERFAEAIQNSIQNEEIRRMPLFGSVNQFCFTTDILESPAACRSFSSLYSATE